MNKDYHSVTAVVCRSGCEDVNTSSIVCEERPSSGQSPVIFYLVFGLLLVGASLTLALFITGRRRRRRSSAANDDQRAPVLAGIRLVVVSGVDRQRSPASRLRRSTPTTTPTARTQDVAEAPGPDTTGNEAS